MKSQIHIDYKLPLNYQPEWEHLFKPDYKYKTVDLKVKELKNVFVNQSGLVLKNGLLVKGCAPNIGFSNYDKGFYFQHWRKASEQMLVCKYGKSLEAIKLDDNRKYLVIHSPWFSYYFWLTECLPRLLMVKEQLHELVLLFPAGWKKFPFVNQTLEMFPQLQTYEIPFGKHLFVKNLVMPEVKPWTPMFIPEQVLEVRKLFFDAIRNEEIQNLNVYLSRKDSNRKNLVNDNEVTVLLEKHNFEIHQMSKFSIFEQVSLMRSTNNIISITGAGMANFMFLKENANVIDLTNIMYLKDRHYKFHFWKLCNIINANYIVQFCEHENNPNIEISPNVPMFGLQNLIVHLPSLEKNLKIIANNIKKTQ